MAKMKNDIPDFTALVKQSENSVLSSISSFKLDNDTSDTEVHEEVKVEDDENDDDEIVDDLISKKNEPRNNQMLFLITSSRRDILRLISFKNKISMSNIINEALDLYIHKKFPKYEKGFKEKRKKNRDRSKN
ncbi:MAG: hypothetical protein UIC45_04270 [Paludibacteraceae bacterium]|nr:hypothetical protein [Paludibacteraceae bacterium]